MDSMVVSDESFCHIPRRNSYITLYADVIQQAEIHLFIQQGFQESYTSLRRNETKGKRSMARSAYREGIHRPSQCWLCHKRGSMGRRKTGRWTIWRDSKQMLHRRIDVLACAKRLKTGADISGDIHERKRRGHY